MLACFQAAGATRQVLALDCADGGVLVLDCGAGALTDARVIGRIAPEEPSENALLLGAMYAADERRGRPRALCPEDLAASGTRRSRENTPAPPSVGPLLDTDGNEHTIGLVHETSLTELRWLCKPNGAAGAGEPVSLRATVGALESYEPPVALTESAIATTAVSVRTLAAELQRLRCSSIVLNRGLREAVARRIAEGASLSEIALRCGRLKYDRRGNPSGETSWLARRIGQLPEGGQPRPTPWIHSNTLALIAREGLCISPREVEL